MQNAETTEYRVKTDGFYGELFRPIARAEKCPVEGQND